MSVKGHLTEWKPSRRERSGQVNGIINHQAGISLPAVSAVDTSRRRIRSWIAPACAHPMALETAPRATSPYVARTGFATAAARAPQRFPVHSRIPE